LIVKAMKLQQLKVLFLIILCDTAKVFRSNECLSTLIQKIYEPNFFSARTKSEAIVTNVLSPYILGEVIEDLNKTKKHYSQFRYIKQKRHQTFSKCCVVICAKLWR
jgi:hypothetical protein